GGVLFKGGGALETLAAVDIFAFDKTGTLTTGKGSVTGVVALDGDEDRFLAQLAGLEAHSEHHRAGARRHEAAKRGVAPVAMMSATTWPSAGIVGEDGAGQVWAGNPRLAMQMNASIDHPSLRLLAAESETVIYAGR